MDDGVQLLECTVTVPIPYTLNPEQRNDTVPEVVAQWNLHRTCDYYA